MKLPDYLRLMGLLLRLRPGRAGSLQPEATRMERCAVDVYAPDRPGGGAVLAVHGLTLDGGRDARLADFARALAASGVLCFVPTLPALADGRLDPADVDVLGALVRACAKAAEGPLCLTGFSLGASYALCAATRKGAQEDLRAILSFNAAHDLNTLLGQALANLRAPSDDTSLDMAIFAALVLTRTAGDRLGLGALQSGIREFLQGFCQRPLAEKRSFFHDHFQGLPLAEVFQGARDQGDWAALSPAGRLGGLRVPVSLIHDRGDRLVPPSHALALGAELPEHRAWITGAVAHVKTGRLAPGDLVPMMRALVPLVSGA